MGVPVAVSVGRAVLQRLVHGTDLVGPVDAAAAPQQRVTFADQRQQRLLATSQVRLVFRLGAHRSVEVIRGRCWVRAIRQGW